MAISSAHDRFSREEQSMAELCKALAHPARIAILRILAERKTCVCGDLVTELPLAQSTVSQHLLELKKAGWIRGEVSGLYSCYCLEPKTVHLWKEIFQEFSESLVRSCSENDSSCC